MPDPSTWVMLMGAASLIGLIGRRRHLAEGNARQKGLKGRTRGSRPSFDTSPPRQKRLAT
ncbi:PEP-CTERM sorting domain-containing protein [Aeoliella sp.]|uniref:PEP-CTERM sorting domain-containing protein n=1 Tax=Aeoliella sp. TaxID=2795800 RepID=UPI003CCBE6CF